jgi:homoserine dehydrogenase
MLAPPAVSGLKLLIPGKNIGDRKMSDFINVGIFGMGNVGGGVVRLLSEKRAIIEKRVGKPVRITKAVVSDLSKRRDLDLSDILMSTNPGDILDDPKIDIVLELIGGLSLAETIILKALARGKSVVTANKALLAEKGSVIFPAAHDAKVCFGFETSVGAGIPIIRTLREGFAGDEILKISGILNGTSNYILSCMSREGMDFEGALEKAQKKGLAETDPTLDIQGIDCAHKLIIMMNIAFNAVFDFSHLYVEGISDITAQDIKYTRQLGYAIKHLGQARATKLGIEARVHPVLVPRDHILASVNGAFNSILVLGEFMGPSNLYGLGAGAGPSAVGVMGDIIQACRYKLTGQKLPVSPFSIPLKMWKPGQILPMDSIQSEYYLRFPVRDRLGVLAFISKVLMENSISVQSVIQKGEPLEGEGCVDIVIITHKAVEADIQRALEKINGQDCICGKTQLIRIEPN